jgi:hypothetical protein
MVCNMSVLQGAEFREASIGKIRVSISVPVKLRYIHNMRVM